MADHDVRKQRPGRVSGSCTRRALERMYDVRREKKNRPDDDDDEGRVPGAFYLKRNLFTFNEEMTEKKRSWTEVCVFFFPRRTHV